MIRYVAVLFLMVFAAVIVLGVIAFGWIVPCFYFLALLFGHDSLHTALLWSIGYVLYVCVAVSISIVIFLYTEVDIKVGYGIRSKR